MLIDARIPLRFGGLADRTVADALLTDGAVDLKDGPGARFSIGEVDHHPAGCACCRPQTAAAAALAGLFRTRAIMPGAAFASVLAVVGPAGEAAVRDALASDPVVSARYRLTGLNRQAGTSASPRPSPRCM